MSGPKVVRVVTREELQAEGLAQLRDLDAALAHCERTARRHDAWTDERASALASRRQEIERLFHRELWSELRRAVSAEISFLQDERARITDAAVSAAELALRRRRRLADAARSIALALNTEGRPVPPGLLTLGERATRSRDDGLAALEAEINTAMVDLGRVGITTGGTEEQRLLAARLARGEQAQTYADWIARRAASEQEADARLGRLVAELSVLAPDQAAPFASRMELIANEPDASRRALLTDSLVLDLGAQVQTARAWSALLPGIEKARALLVELQGEEATALLARVQTVLESRQAEAVPALVAAARSLSEDKARRRAGVAKRQAVLQGLASLGYEVREHMETAWAQGGRIVVRKPGVTDYGVELASPADAERIQLRLVGASTPVEPRTASRDRDAEAQWCTQVAQLQTAIGAEGSGFVIERALPVGAQPVKTVAFDDASATEIHHREVPRSQERRP